jgi:trk system potassium uptake protein TrkH
MCFNYEDTMKKHFRMTTTRVIALGFFLTILAGTLLLSLPFATVKGEHTGILDALFTATTSVCVTGLVVVDTISHWTIFGKIIILILIQIGGLGVVSITSLIMLLLRRKFTLKSYMLMQDAYNLNTKQGLRQFTLRVFKGTILVELIGAVLYSISFCSRFGVLKGIWYSVFNSISAFCNAGIDIIGTNSLMDYHSNPLVILTSAMLIIAGGLGFVVWWDIIDVISGIAHKKIKITSFWSRLQLHSRLVIIMTVLLLGLGTLVIYLFERNNPLTIGNFSAGDKLLNSFFQSVTLRTAGFASISQKGLKNSSALFSMMLMFIGGSPAGTAGGIKTVTFAVVFFTFLSMIQERDEIVVFNRKIPNVMVKKSVTIVFISLMSVIIFSILLLFTNDVDFVDALYEMFSAIATVGLSRGITPSLNVCGKLIIVFCMYLGRIGPISMAVAFNSENSYKNLVHYPEEEIIVG